MRAVEEMLEASIAKPIADERQHASGDERTVPRCRQAPRRSAHLHSPLAACAPHDHLRPRPGVRETSERRKIDSADISPSNVAPKGAAGKCQHAQKKTTTGVAVFPRAGADVALRGFATRWRAWRWQRLHRRG